VQAASACEPCAIGKVLFRATKVNKLNWSVDRLPALSLHRHVRELSRKRYGVEVVVGIITRHPMRQDELERTLNRWLPEQVIEALTALEASGAAQIGERYGLRFWSATPAHYPDKGKSQRTIPGRNQGV